MPMPRSTGLEDVFSSSQEVIRKLGFFTKFKGREEQVLRKHAITMLAGLQNKRLAGAVDTREQAKRRRYEPKM
jgi:hypothetical protein